MFRGNILYDFNKVKLQNVINLYSRGLTSFATSLARSSVSPWHNKASFVLLTWLNQNVRFQQTFFRHGITKQALFCSLGLPKTLKFCL
ncbi:MAG: hypothetical protein ACI3ZZ_00110 [Candidatus Aphodosoma sp.]